MNSSTTKPVRSTPIRIALVIGASLLLPALASAQHKRTVSFGASAGGALPLGDLGNIESIGYDIAGHLHYKPQNSRQLSFRADVAYDKWNDKNKGATVVEASFSSLTIAGNALYMAGDEKSDWRPYALAGVGRFKTTRTFARTLDGLLTESSNFGVQAGVGAEFALGNISTFAEARYVTVFSSPTKATFAPIVFGVHLR